MISGNPPTTGWSSSLRIGARAGVPLAIAGLVDGFVFGTLARQAGLTAVEATLMSGFVNAGSAQFLAIGLWASPLPIATILLTTLSVNLRHLLMGATLRSWLTQIPARRAYPSLFFLSDESWALSTQAIARQGVHPAFLLGSGLILFAGWVSATFAGATAGQLISDPRRWGLDFAFTALFVAILAGLWPGRRRIAPWVAAGATAVVASRVLPTGWHVLAGGLVGAFVGVIDRGK